MCAYCFVYMYDYVCMYNIIPVSTTYCGSQFDENLGAVKCEGGYRGEEERRNHPWPRLVRRRWNILSSRMYTIGVELEKQR